MQDLHCFMRDLFTVVHGLSSYGAGAPEAMRWVVAACRLSRSAACGILVPQPGIEPTSSAVKA